MAKTCWQLLPYMAVASTQNLEADEFGSGHFRTITLPPMETLEEAYDKIERFIKRNTN